MDQTMQLAYRIALVWAMGFLIAVILRAALPANAGVMWPGSDEAFFVAYRRVAYWTCILATTTSTAVVVVRALMADFGAGAGR